MTLDCIELKFISHLLPLGMLFNSCVISRDGIEDGGHCGGVEIVLVNSVKVCMCESVLKLVLHGFYYGDRHIK